MRIVFRPKYIGLENIPATGRVVLAGNHTSFFDCVLIISTTNRTVHFLAKDSLMKGFKKILFGNMGIIPVNRAIHDKNALQAAIDALNNDEVIGIFPEGTINRRDDIIMPFKMGAVKMSSATKADIVPFTITGDYKVFGKQRPTIEFMKPIRAKHKDLDKDNQILMDIISKKLEEKRNQ
jgi:1-acyl-sn-glycerol-3-phosphate acyltransferase